MSTIKSSSENLTLNADGSGNDVLIQSNGSTKAIVTAEGKLGIGTASPAKPLEIKTASDTVSNLRLQGQSGFVDISGHGGNGSDFVILPEGTEKFRITEGGDVKVVSGNMLMGTSVTGRANEGAHRLTIADSGHSGLTIRSGTGSYGSINFSDSEGGTGEYAGSIWYGHGGLGEKLVIAIEGSNRLTVDGDGIKFNNDTAAANALDDYEEGTWTPTWTGANSSAGTYTKIGRMVYASGQFVGTGSATSGDCGGLPYASAIDGSDGGGSGYHGQDAVTWSVLKISSTGFRFYTGSSQKQIASTNGVRFFLTYHV